MGLLCFWNCCFLLLLLGFRLGLFCSFLVFWVLIGVSNWGLLVVLFAVHILV